MGSLSNHVHKWTLEASWLVLLFCECLLPLFGSEARMYSLKGGRKPLCSMITGVPLGASFQRTQFVQCLQTPKISRNIFHKRGSPCPLLSIYIEDDDGNEIEEPALR